MTSSRNQVTQGLRPRAPEPGRDRPSQISGTRDGRRSYRAPHLMVYGSLGELTRTASGTAADGGVDPFGFPQFSGLAG